VHRHTPGSSRPKPRGALDGDEVVQVKIDDRLQGFARCQQRRDLAPLPAITPNSAAWPRSPLISCVR
jgi:hypothetical protein